MRAFVLAVLVCVLAGAAGAAEPALRVGSKRFTESYILGEIVAQAARAAGAPAVHKPGLGNTAIVVQALAYALATRTGAPGRGLYHLALSLAIGLIGGWLTVETGGIGAAFLGHAVARAADFAFLGGDGASAGSLLGAGVAAGPARGRGG